MRFQPFPHQLIGADFLAQRKAALLADSPRVGKTGAAIIAADYIGAERTLVVTTASGRPVLARGFKDWSVFKRRTEVLYSGPLTKAHLTADRLVVGWPALTKHREALSNEAWDLGIYDESHYAKSLEAKRTQALFGAGGISESCAVSWCLSGSPIPNSPNEIFPMLKALCPERLLATGDTPDVSTYDKFLHRYCVTRKKFLSRWNSILIVIGGRNLEELNARLKGFWLRRTQQDVGITSPIYDLLPIHISEAQRRKIEAEVEGAEDILAAAETGETKSLDMHLASLRKATGSIKATGVIQTVRDEMEGGLDKIVVMCWHKDVIAAIADGLSKYGVVSVHGGTSPHHRAEAMEKFQNGNFRVFVGQIKACGEAIDLSAASELIFAESSFVPADMAQAAFRITNFGQQGRPRVRVAALEGSIDEALQSILTRKVKTIMETMK